MKRRLSLHLLFWLTFWFIYAYTYSRYDGNFGKYAVTEGLQMPARILATYLSFWAFERFSGIGGHREWFAFGGAAAANIIGGLLNRVVKMLYVVPVYFPDSTFTFWGHMVTYDVFDCVLASGTALTARLYFRQQVLSKRAAELQSEKLSAELQALKGQIHPHFLFNTINNIYALARRKSEKTAPVALKLASLLRYVLYESAKPSVRLSQEIQNLNDYVELEKLRFDEDRLSVKMTAETDDPDRQIPPLLLLPLVENAFKHGVSEKRTDAWVKIHISLINNILHCKVENAKSSDYTGDAKGIGLRNLRRQLELLYPDRHSLLISDTEDTFTAELRIDL